MKKYVVMVTGENFLVQFDEGPVRVGFEVVRYVESKDADKALDKALQMINEDEDLAEIVINEESDPATLSAEVVDEPESFEGIENLEPDYLFYPEDDEEDEEDGEDGNKSD